MTVRFLNSFGVFEDSQDGKLGEKLVKNCQNQPQILYAAQGMITGLQMCQ